MNVPSTSMQPKTISSFTKALLVAILMGLSVRAGAQSTASMTGTVTDSSGAVIVGAHVVITHDSTGKQTLVETNKNGDFAVSNLQVGTYTIRIDKSGFHEEVEHDVTLLTGQTINVRASLKLGVTDETITVTAGGQQIETTVSDVKFSVDRTQMENLPLNGRNPFDLATLAPGATVTAASTKPGEQDNPGLSVNGFSVTQNNWLLDGSVYNNLNFGSAPTLPNPDTLQEFTIQTGTFSAENRGGGAVIKLTTRSGTNAFHGDVFEYFRNTVLDATNYFDTTASIYKHNQFGGTIGGPILRNRLFFFGSYQGTIQRGSPSPEPVTVPTPAERNGVFPNVIINPATKKPFSNNTIPKPFDSIGQQLMSLYPVAANGGNLYYTPTNSNRNDNQYLARIDYQATRKDLITARYFFDHNVLDHDWATVPGLKGNDNFTNQTLLVSDIHTFSPNWILHAYFNHLQTYRHEVPVTPVTMQDLGANVTPSTLNAPRKIYMVLNGYTKIYDGNGLDFNPRTDEYSVDVSHVAGTHFLRFGGAIRHDVEYAKNYGTEYGEWAFTITRTASSAYKGSGDSFASMLLGLPQTFTQNSTTPQNFLLNIFDMWAQDDWKITPRLTLNLGIRYEPWLPAHDQLGLMSAFVPGAHSTLAPLVPKGLLFSGDPGIPASITHDHWNSFSPRFGFAYDLRGNGSTVLRAGVGIFRQGTEFFGQLRTFANATPTRTASVSITQPPSTMNPYSGYTGTIPFPFVATPASQLSTYTLPSDYALEALDPNTKPEYAESYSIALEQRITPSSSVSVTYVGNHMVHGIITYDANPAIYLPGATTSTDEARRMYPGYADITYGTTGNPGSYNGLQVQYHFKGSHGVNATANYVYSKTLDITSSGEQGTYATLGISDPFNLAKDYGPADFDLRHQLKAAVVYMFPTTHKHSAFVRGLANGWQTNVIAVLQTGLPFTCRSGVDNSLSGVNLDHCDQIGPTTRPAGVSKFTQWINISSFTTNAIGTFGNMGRNSLRRPASMNTNVSLVKNFPLSETVKGQFRVEAFNALNRPNFDLYDTSSAYVNSQVVTSPTFGQLTAASDPRVLQFALKVIF